MMNYSIGYYNKLYNRRNIFVVMAQTESKAVAMFIRDSYRDAYKRNGISTELVIVEGNLPKEHRFAE